MINEENRRNLYARYRETHAAPDMARDISVPQYAGRAFGAYFRTLLPKDRHSRLLDLGCGRGEFLAFLATEGYISVTGVDLSEDQVDHARRTGIPSVVQNDIKQFLATCMDSYDCIFAIDVLEHFSVNEIMNLLTLIHNVLAPGGRFIMRAPNAGSPFFGSIRYGDLTHETAFTKSAVEQLFRNVGFRRFGILDAGPRIYGLKSAVRAVVWRTMTLFLRLYSLAEMGSADQILSRNLIAWADKEPGT